MTKHADFKRRVRARMAKTGESYAAARIHVRADRPDPDTWGTALHVTNGGCTVPALRDTGLAHDILVWADVLHEGPVPDVGDDELRRIRAAFLDAAHARDLGTVTRFTERDRMLAAHRDGQYVLWFEADLYDQLQVIQILAGLSALGVPPERITLICVGEFLGIARFAGLGQLDSAQMSRLPAIAATPLTTAALDHATQAWTAFRAPEPSGLGLIVRTPSRELRFVAEAFDRLSREYPSVRDGLSLTERRILAAVAEGASTACDVFGRAAARENRPFLGDGWCFDRMTRFVRASTPLLETESTGPVDMHTRVRLTDAGRRVLEGQDDHVALNGIDRWIGGVHLSGRDLPWRWNDATESITATR